MTTIWPLVFGAGGAAVLAGSLAVPLARSFLLGELRHDWLADELPFERVEPDGQTVRGKDGALSRVYHLRGVSYDAKVEQEQTSLMLGRSALLHQLGGKGLQVRLYGVKRQRDLSYEATWPCSTLAEIGAAEAERFRSSYYVDWYMVLTARTMQPLLDGQGSLYAMASDYAPQAVVQPDTAVGASLPHRLPPPCPLTGFLNGLVCGDYRDDLPALSRSLSGSLPASDLSFGKDGVIETLVPTKHLHRVIAVKEWPETVSGRLLADILAVPGDIEVCQVCEPWDSDTAMIQFKRQLMAQRTALIGNPALAGEADTLLSLLTEGNTTLFATQFQIILRAPSEAALNDLVQAVGTILGHKRVLYSVETIGAPLCWFARLPTALPRARLSAGGKMLRPLHLRDQNIAALWAFTHSATGMMTSPFGKAPVRFFSTPTGRAYAFQFHVEDKPQSRGNYLVFAPTGGGKSTLMMHLLGGLAKFDGVRSYIFDSKEGAKFMVEAMGGLYQGYDSLSLNPLDVGPDTPSARHRVYSILRAMVGDTALTEEDEAALDHAAELAFKVEPPERTLSTIYTLAFNRRTTLRRAFAKWVIDEKGHKGLHSHVFNAPHDSLGSILAASHMVAINMNEALDDPTLGPPVVAHISTAISNAAAANSRGFTILVEEAAKLLQNDGFKALAMEMFREYRKLNGAVGLAFQDPAALLRSGAAEAFIENTATFIFLPNSQATPASLAPFNLNEEQMAFVLGGSSRRGKRREALIIKRDAASGFDESAIMDIDLSPLGSALRFYRAGTDANKHLANLKTQWGDQWLTHV